LPARSSSGVNAIGPALVAKHFLPLLARGRSTAFAALSARVGSISDNRLGGWYGYRASKAALNMLIKTLSIELARTRPEAVCVALHPGTVDTRLSGPFQRSVAPDQLFTPEVSGRHLLRVLERLVPSDSGGCFAWNGKAIDP
jgi:NAD(P)-dependent dehydrogenase (short-subunit alcohol dehydrogenase family)